MRSRVLVCSILWLAHLWRHKCCKHASNIPFSMAIYVSQFPWLNRCKRDQVAIQYFISMMLHKPLSLSASIWDIFYDARVWSVNGRVFPQSMRKHILKQFKSMFSEDYLHAREHSYSWRILIPSAPPKESARRRRVTPSSNSVGTVRKNMSLRAAQWVDHHTEGISDVPLPQIFTSL